MNDETSLIAEYDQHWPAEFARLARNLRTQLGELAIRIDHIGSTAVPGLAAKPVLDLQISVRHLDPVDAYRAHIEQCGFTWRPENPEQTKRYFRELPGARRTHVHVRRTGSFSEQFALLFRDYLRAHPERADAYAAEKRRLAPLLHVNRGQYVEAKEPFIWNTIRVADAWAQREGWEPGPSDA